MKPKKPKNLRLFCRQDPTDTLTVSGDISAGRIVVNGVESCRLNAEQCDLLATRLQEFAKWLRTQPTQPSPKLAEDY